MECRIIYFFLQGCTLLQVARLASTATPSAGSWMRPGKVLVSALSTTCSSVTWLPSSTSWSSHWLGSHSSFSSQVQSCQRLRQKNALVILWAIKSSWSYCQADYVELKALQGAQLYSCGASSRPSHEIGVKICKGTKQIWFGTSSILNLLFWSPIKKRHAAMCLSS